MLKRILVGPCAAAVWGVCSAQLGPFPEADLPYAMHVCSDTSYFTNGVQSGIGEVADLDASNHGCLLGNEHQGVWMHFNIATAGAVGFTLAPPAATDYDFAVWGPFVAPPAVLPDAPLRCGWSAITGAVGLDYVATDLTEGAQGDGWLRYMDVQAGEWYVLYVDNYSLNGVGFNLVWQLQDGATLQCLPPPEAGFAASNSTVVVGAPVAFTDGSSNQPYAWYWEFPGGLPATSEDQNPQAITYAVPGCYDVSLTAYNGAGESTATAACLLLVGTTTNMEPQRPAAFGITQANGMVQVKPLVPMDTYRIRLIDAAGRVLQNSNMQGTAEMDTHALPAGAYTIAVESATGRMTQRIAIVH